MSVLATFCILVTIQLSSVVVVSGVDRTRVPGGNGADVVEAVVDVIRESCLFADDRRFLRRLAYVQSHDGTDPKTYRPGYDGGIWQVGLSKFRSTQTNSNLTSQYAIIQREFGIDWNSVRWGDLRKPLYSGIAAALYTILQGGVGWRVEEQAKFYSDLFYSNGANNFTKEVVVLDKGCYSNAEIELVFVTDRSCSLSTDDFERAKYFMQNVVEGFNIGPTQTQVAVVSYATNTRVEFFLNSHSDKNSVTQAIDNMVYDCGQTATDAAITQAVDQVLQPSRGSRLNSVKVIVVVTDGHSDDFINTKHAAQKAHANHIVTFAVGVGHDVSNTELNTIGTSPSCTHVFTVSDYTEIKALKEELQKSTCRAPVYIQMNHTYTCTMNKCPPLAVITPPGGVTVESNISCDGMNVYTAFNNPYPGGASYQTLETVDSSNPGQLFRNNSKLETLFIGLKGTPGAEFCTVHVTPWQGDHIDHAVKCFQNGVQIKCPEDCTEKWNYNVFCNKTTLEEGKTKFPHPSDPTKYLMFDMACKLYIVQCPQNMTYYQSCQQCVGADTPCTPGHSQLPDTFVNPCTAENILKNKFFFEYPKDPTKYIHCDVWGKAWVQSCPAGEEWNQRELTCTEPSTFQNPCYNNSENHFIQFFPYPCDDTKYIQCDMWHESFTKDCNLGFVYDVILQICIPPDNAHTVNHQIDCTYLFYNGHNGGTNGHVVNTAPPAIQTLPPGHSPGYTYCSGCAEYTSPCTRDNVANYKLYFPVRDNRHQYIQCTLTGQMYLRDCTGNGITFFDAATSTCVDGPLPGVGK